MIEKHVAVLADAMNKVVSALKEFQPEIVHRHEIQDRIFNEKMQEASEWFVAIKTKMERISDSYERKHQLKLNQIQAKLNEIKDVMGIWYEDRDKGYPLVKIKSELEDCISKATREANNSASQFVSNALVMKEEAIKLNLKYEEDLKQSRLSAINNVVEVGIETRDSIDEIKNEVDRKYHSFMMKEPVNMKMKKTF